MGKIVYRRIGDIFEVVLPDCKRYFQYVASDLTMLNGDAIEVFARKYAPDENPFIDEIVNDDPDFYAHTTLKWGIELGYWRKYGFSPVIRDFSGHLQTSVA